MAVTVMRSFKDCHLTHKTCPLRGDNCVAKSMLVGFFEEADNYGVSMSVEGIVTQALNDWETRPGAIFQDIANDVHPLPDIGNRIAPSGADANRMRSGITPNGEGFCR